MEAWAIDPPVRTTSSSGWAWRNTIVEAGAFIDIELATRATALDAANRSVRHLP
jgi:hypothetical protein